MYTPCARGGSLKGEDKQKVVGIESRARVFILPWSQRCAVLIKFLRLQLSYLLQKSLHNITAGLCRKFYYCAEIKLCYLNL